MHEAAKLCPIVADEALTDLESLLLAREMGYTGVALKACKGQTHAMLLAAAAQKFGMFLCVQDLTCPGASLIHSAGIAARVPGNAGIEANGRQFVPSANARLGGEVSRAVHDPRWSDEDRPADRTGARGGSSPIAFAPEAEPVSADAPAQVGEAENRSDAEANRYPGHATVIHSQDSVFSPRAETPQRPRLVPRPQGRLRAARPRRRWSR